MKKPLAAVKKVFNLISLLTTPTLEHTRDERRNSLQPTKYLLVLYDVKKNLP
jgi:hypothetical protein